MMIKNCFYFIFFYLVIGCILGLGVYKPLCKGEENPEGGSTQKEAISSEGIRHDVHPSGSGKAIKGKIRSTESGQTIKDKTVSIGSGEAIKDRAHSSESGKTINGKLHLTRTEEIIKGKARLSEAVPSPNKPTEEEKGFIMKRLGQLPAFFIENRGQLDPQVRYYFKGKDNVYFTDEGVVFQEIERKEKDIRNLAEESAEGPRGRLPERPESSQKKPGQREYRALSYRLEFLGANPTSPQAREVLPGRVNYLTGNDPRKWHSNISTYREIVYPGLYGESRGHVRNVSLSADPIPGAIDLVYKGVEAEYLII